jgi:hypothetical protein
MKAAVFLGSLLIGLVLAGIPAYNEGFSRSSIGEWFFNALLVAGVLGFLGMKFLVNEPTRSSTPSAKKSKKKK